MRWVLFYHSLVSDWNHGNAHFLRGIVSELVARGEDVEVYEPKDGWSRTNLVAEHGPQAAMAYRRAYPNLRSRLYELDAIDLAQVLSEADVVLVHEWNEPELVRRIGEHRRRGGAYQLLFHDTHHRAVTAPQQMQKYDLSDYDGVLAFGEIIRQTYLERGWAARAWTWHEAADVRVFKPRPKLPEGELVWIGNWGDGERKEEIREFLLEPVQALGISARVYGVRYPAEARQAVADAGAKYLGWLPNFRVPHVFGKFKVTVHIPRRPYRERMPGIPTIRVFEALACGLPLVTAPWDDAEGLFRTDQDFLVANNGKEMRDLVRAVLHDRLLGEQLARAGRETIFARHTCGHRVDELLSVLRELGGPNQAVQRGSNYVRKSLPDAVINDGFSHMSEAATTS